MKFNANRGIARYHRSCMVWILEMHAKTQRYRAHKIDYENWTKTPEYQAERKRIEALIERVNKEPTP